MLKNEEIVKPLIIDQENNRILFAKKYLGLDDAELWIGPGEEGPSDDDDELVIKRREEAVKAWQEGRTNRPSGISVYNLQDNDGDDYYELTINSWPAGYYRFNYHGPANTPTPSGTPLEKEKRDLQYSWAIIPDNRTLQDPNIKPFIYWEPNGRGYCFRIHIDENGRISSAGKEKIN